MKHEPEIRPDPLIIYPEEIEDQRPPAWLAWMLAWCFAVIGCGALYILVGVIRAAVYYWGGDQ